MLTYTSPEGPELGRGKGEGIYLFEMNRSTGALTERKVVTHDVNPTWVALDPSKSHLYVACEAGNFRGAHSGSVTAYSIEPASGDLTLLNTVSSGGGGPCHVSVHPSGKYALVANFGGATVAVLPIRPNGELGSASDVKHDVGKVRAIDPTSAPAGKLAAFNHTSGAHAHMIQADPTGRFIFSVRPGARPDLHLEARSRERHSPAQRSACGFVAARRRTAPFCHPQERTLAVFAPGTGFHRRLVRTRPAEWQADREAESFHPSGGL